MWLLEHALKYRNLGWSILPIGNGKRNKKPALGTWKKYQTRLPSEDELQEWFKRSGVAGLAVVLGQVSGGLYCRDFDDQAAYDRWATEHPDLARKLPTVRTGRGYHVYFGSTIPIETKNLGDGELRGDGVYVVLPPSMHESGKLYEWVVPLTDGPLPCVDPVAAGLSHNGCTEWTESTERTEPPSNTPHKLSLHTLYKASVAQGIHQTHRVLFKHARAVRALERQEKRGLSNAELRGTFDQWYTASRGFLRTDQSRDEYWFEFLDMVSRVKHPLGDDAISKAWERAQHGPTPNVATQFSDERIQMLVKVCRELQRFAGEQPFFLSCRIVAGLFGLPSHSTTSLWLRGLCRLKVIEEIEKGCQASHRASRYRYLHPLEDDQP